MKWTPPRRLPGFRLGAVVFALSSSWTCLCRWDPWVKPRKQMYPANQADARDLVCALQKLFWLQNWRAGPRSGWTPSKWCAVLLGCLARVFRTWGDKARLGEPWRLFYLLAGLCCLTAVRGRRVPQGPRALYISWGSVHAAGLGGSLLGFLHLPWEWGLLKYLIAVRCWPPQLATWRYLWWPLPPSHRSVRGPKWSWECRLIVITSQSSLQPSIPCPGLYLFSPRAFVAPLGACICLLNEPLLLVSLPGVHPLHCSPWELKCHSDHFTLLLRHLHWLPTTHRIESKESVPFMCRAIEAPSLQTPGSHLGPWIPATFSGLRAIAHTALLALKVLVPCTWQNPTLHLRASSGVSSS